MFNRNYGAFCGTHRPESIFMFHNSSSQLKFCIGLGVFGYDSNSDDYKVVSMARSKLANDGSAMFVVWVYSLKSGLWKSIGDSLISFSVSGSVVCLLVVHCIGECGRHSEPNGYNLIVALDLGKLEYHLVPQPHEMPLRLGVLNGCLYAISCDHHS
ncbi:hypothetical protein Pfo_003767 [Paulownia fortunei]|nr:hypothetical protein Pfo_003767 [Paulownia fortunei]